MDVLTHVAKRIKQLRIESGLSQESLAKSLDIATNTVSRWETEAYKPSIKDLDALARFFKTSILTFFPETSADPVGAETKALLRAATNLPPEDIKELRRFAEFKAATKLHKAIK